MKDKMIDELVDLHAERHGQTPMPDGALTFDELYASFCEKMGWKVQIKRVREIVASKVETGEWLTQREGNQRYYWLNPKGAA